MKMCAKDAEFHTDRLRAGRKSGRWTWQRKESLIMLVEARLLTPAQAGERYGFSREELTAMQIKYDRHGGRGLSTRMIQAVR